MREYPISFSAEMVQAILNNKKSETRRIPTAMWRKVEVGDRLWVKELFQKCSCAICRQYWPKKPPLSEEGRIHYPTYEASHHGPSGLVWTSSRFMPRWTSRITLEVASKRIERLRNITENSAWAEGFKSRANFGIYWDILSYKRGYGWDTNPEVIVFTFKRIEAERKDKCLTLP